MPAIDNPGVNDAPVISIGALPIVQIGTELRVNSLTALDQNQPAIAGLAGGGFVAVWRSRSGDDSFSGIRAQIFDVYGTKVGTEFLVNTRTLVDQLQPAVTSLATGGFVVTWADGSTEGGDVDLLGIKAQIFDASGAKVGAEFLVNTQTAGSQSQPVIAALSSGGFVASWSDGSSSNIKAQLFDAAGAPVGGELLVNTQTANSQSQPAITALATGGFVVSWTDASGGGGDNSGQAVKAQIFDPAGTRVGAEFLVNSAVTGDQSAPSLAALASGGFVAAWADQNGDGSSYGIKAQIFDASGAKVGIELLANSRTLNAQTEASVVALASGGFVVSWRDVSGLGGDASGAAIRAQKFDASGIRIGTELLVNGATLNDQIDPSVAALTSGGFVVGWTDSSGQGGDASGSGIKAQLSAPLACEQLPYDLKGVILVDDVDAGTGILTLTLSLDYGVLDVAAGTSGASVSGSGTDTVTVEGTLAQIQALLAGDPASTLAFIADTDTPPAIAQLEIRLNDGGHDGTDPGLSGEATSEEALASLVIAIAPINDAPTGSDRTLTLVEDGVQIFAPAQFGFDDVEGDGFSGVVVTTLPALGSLLLNGVSVAAGATIALADIEAGRLTYVPAANGVGAGYASFTFQVKDDGGTDRGGVDLDPTPDRISFDITPVNDAPTVSVSQSHWKVGPELLVSSNNLDTDFDSAITGLTSGHFVVTWSRSAFITGEPGTRAQAFDASGTVIGGSFFVATGSGAPTPTVGALTSGGYVIAWRTLDSSGSGIVAQVFNASGAIGPAFPVNTSTADEQTDPSISGLSSGGFVVTWMDRSGSGGDSPPGAIKAQIFDASGAKIGGELLVNTSTAGSQELSTVTGLASGGFVVTWKDENGDSSGTCIKAQIFDAAGARVGGEFLVNLVPWEDQGEPFVAALPSGGFIVTWSHWSTFGGDDNGSSIKAQIFNASGTKIDWDFIANTTGWGNQHQPAVAVLPSGRFLITWTDESGVGGDASGTSIKAQLFEPDGAKIGGEFLVASSTAGNQYQPEVAILPSGRIMISWTDESRDVDSTAPAIKAQVLAVPEAFEQIPFSLKGAINVGDVDAGSGLVTVTLSTDYGQLIAAAGTSGASVSGSGTSSVTIMGTLTQVQTLLGSNNRGSLSFVADGDDPPASAQISIIINDRGNGGVDPGITGDSTSEEASATLTLFILPVNDAPTSADQDLVLPINTTHVFTLADFAFQDGDGDGLKRVAIYDMVSNGKLMVDVDGPGGNEAVSVQPFGPSSPAIITRAVIEGGGLFFFPDANESGQDYASFHFAVESDGGAPGLSPQYLFSFDVNAVNQAPVHSLPASLSTIEGNLVAFAGSVVIDPAPPVVSDPDSPFITTRLTVADGTLTSWNHGGAQVTGEGTSGVTLYGSVAEVNQALYSMAYTPAAGVSGTRVITVTTDDGELSDIDTIIVDIADFGIEPVGQDVSRGTRENVQLQLGAADFPFSDSEGQELAGVVLSSLPAHGSIINTVGWEESVDLTGDGVPDLFIRRFEYGAGDEISRADLDAAIVFYVPDAETSGTDAFTFQIRDTGGPDFGENLDQTPNSFSIEVEAVNDLPVTVPNPSSAPEDFPFVTVMLQASDLEDGGTEAPTFRIDNLPAHGVLTNAGVPVSVDDEIPADYYHSGAGGWLLLLGFEPDANWSGSTGFDYVAIDSEGGESSAATATIVIDPIADAPIVDPNVNDGAEPVGLALNITGSTSAEDLPSITALDHGRTLVVWQRGLPSSNIVAQPFAADGTPERQLFSVTNFGGPNETHPVVAGKPDGSFAIAWVQQGTGTGGGDIPVAFYNPGATSPTLFVVAIGSEDAIESAPSIAALSEGWVVVARTDAGGGAIRVQPYAADLSAGAPLTILDGAGAATVTPLGDTGDYVVIGTFPDGSIQQVLVSGGVAGAPVDVFDGPGGSNAEVTPLADGGYVVVWTHDDGAGNKALYGRLYDATGAASTDVVLLTETSLPSEFAADVAALPDGRFVVTWVGDNGVGPSRDIFAQFFAFDGSPIGPPIPVTATGLGSTFPNLPIEETRPTIIVLEDGRFTIGWLQTPATGGNNSDIFLRTYVASEAEVSGISGEPITLPTTVALADTDGSEILASVRLVFLPAGFTLPVGERVGTDWVIDRSSAAEADFLDALAAGNAALTVTAPSGFSGFFNLAIIATSRETSDPSETATSVGVVPILVTDPLRLDLNGSDVGTDANVDFTEDGGAILVAPAALALGGTDTDLDGAVLALALATSAEAADLVEIVGNGSGPGQIDVTGSDVRFGGIVIGTLAGGAGTLTVTFNANADAVSLQALLQRIAFTNGSDNPSDLARTLSVTLVDGSNGLISAAEATIHVEPVDDPGTAANDSVSIDENGTIAGPSLFGNDSDPDGPTLEVELVNGDTANVGTRIMLASGALLTVNADGSYEYDPNGNFGYLISTTKGLATGAVNISATDTFTYALAGGDTATVTITITGVDNLLDQLRDDAGNNVITGTAGPDLFVLFEGGTETVAGGTGDSNDRFYFGNTLDTTDSVDGGGGEDSLILGGDYDYTFSATNMVGIERLRLLHDTVAGDFDYTLHMIDANVAAGATLRVDALDLLAGEDLIFDGHFETDGSFQILGGAGFDTLVGGLQNDEISGGAGNDTLFGLAGNDSLIGDIGADHLIGGTGKDTFLYTDATDSTGLQHDVLNFFEPRIDKIDLPGTWAGWAAAVGAGTLASGSFDADLAAAVDANLGAHQSILFTPDAGDFAGSIFVVVDGNGDGNYTSGTDFVFEFSNPVEPLTSFSFVI